MDQPTPPPTAAPGPGDGSSGQECFVNFRSMLQLKVSAKPAGDALEVLDSNPIAIPSIPIEVNGDQVSISGDKFPVIILTRLSNSADLRFSGVAGTKATGTLNAETGEIKIDGMQFNLEVLQKGTTQPLLPGKSVIGGIQLTTGTVTATGNLNPIQEQGKPLDKGDLSLTLVFGVTLPRDFTPLVPLNAATSTPFPKIAARPIPTTNRLPDKSSPKAFRSPSKGSPKPLESILVSRRWC
ncbi:MAG: hypothetical protein K8R69_07990 [Deltaproteobacteria bacterium]|nr:hypothetical protein [Deltaproteobacteria bacterium]